MNHNNSSVLNIKHFTTTIKKHLHKKRKISFGTAMFVARVLREDFYE